MCVCARCEENCNGVFYLKRTTAHSHDEHKRIHIETLQMYRMRACNTIHNYLYLRLGFISAITTYVNLSYTPTRRSATQIKLLFDFISDCLFHMVFVQYSWLLPSFWLGITPHNCTSSSMYLYVCVCMWKSDI